MPVSPEFSVPVVLIFPEIFVFYRDDNVVLFNRRILFDKA